MKPCIPVFLDKTVTAGAHLVVPYDLYAAALCLDGPTLANLELLEGSSGEAEGSLLAALDTCASPGKGIASLRREETSKVEYASGHHTRSPVLTGNPGPLPQSSSLHSC